MKTKRRERLELLTRQAHAYMGQHQGLCAGHRAYLDDHNCWQPIRQVVTYENTAGQRVNLCAECAAELGLTTPGVTTPGVTM